MDLEFRRNLLHLVMGTLIAAGILVMGKDYSLAFFSISLLVGILLSEYLVSHRVPLFSFFVDNFERQGQRPGKGVITFFIGALITVTLFDVQTAFLSVLIVAFLDSFATIFGKAFGKFKIYRKKTFIGFLSGYLSSLGVTVLFIPLPLAMAVCFTASLTEVFLTYDNVCIPLFSGLTLTILTVLI